MKNDNIKGLRHTPLGRRGEALARAVGCAALRDLPWDPTPPGCTPVAVVWDIAKNEDIKELAYGP